MTDHQLAQIIWDYMRYEQPVEKSDVIIGLGCNDISVARHAADLYLQGYAPKIVFSGAQGRMTTGRVDNEAEWFTAEAISMGVPKNAILQEKRATNTGENVRYVYELLREAVSPSHRIIIVHKPYMLRRDYATVMKQWPNSSDFQFRFSAQEVSMDKYAVADQSFEQTVAIMVGDLQRIREYPKLGYQIELDIPGDVWGAYLELVDRGYTSQLLV